MVVLFLILSLLSGQLVKIPLIEKGGATILDLVILALCLWGLIKIKFKLVKPPLFISAGLIFAAIAAFSLLLTPLKLELMSKIISFFYTVRFSSYLLFGWLIYSNAFPYLRKNLDFVLIFSGVGLAALGIFQFIFFPDLKFLTSAGWDPHYLRTASTFLDPNFMGAFSALTLLLISQTSLLNKKLNLKKLLFVLVYSALLTTFSRGAYLVLALGFLILSILKKSTILGLLTIILALGLVVGYLSYHRQIAQPRHIDRAQSAQYRLNSWQQGLTIFQKNPILGVGFNSYHYALVEYKLGDEQFLSSHGSSSNDSSLLFVAATTGVVGLSFYLFFLFSLIRQFKQNPLLVAGLVGLIGQSFFANTLFYPFLLIWIILVALRSK